MKAKRVQTNQFFSKKRTLTIIIGIILVILVLPYILVQPEDLSVTFNQHYIESVDSHHNAATLSEKARSSFSYYTLLWNSLKTEKQSNHLNFDDPSEMFDYLFNTVPSYAIVYPTELYYYYLFPTNDTDVSGNLRLVEIENGNIGMGYFDRTNTRRSNHKLFGFDDGLRIQKTSDTTYKATYNGKTVTFKIADISEEEPESFELLPEETFITKVRDESGIILHLLFNKAESAFYYVLDEDREVTELFETKEHNVLIGARTGFAYYHDTEHNRKTLFGVSIDNIRENNYFDGPFDQVSPFLDIRDEIYAVYPYTQFGSGVDTHGNFIDRDGVRVAISPYLDYQTEADLYTRLTDCELETETTPQLWSCLTYEDKRDYHLDSPLFYQNGTLKQDTDEDFYNETTTEYNE